MSSTFSGALARIMEEREISVIAIAEVAKVERQTVYNWLDGGYPRREPLNRLCKFFEMSESELMHGRVEFNGQRLTKVIEMVEKTAERHKIKLSATKKARIIALFYERVADGEEITPKEVGDVIKISA